VREGAVELDHPVAAAAAVAVAVDDGSLPLLTFPHYSNINQPPNKQTALLF